MELQRLLLLDDAEAVPCRRVQDPTAPEPEGDVVGAVAGAVRDEIARTLALAGTGTPAASCCHASRGTRRPASR